MINGLVVGKKYSKAALANLMSVTRIASHREGPLYLPQDGIALLFVTLNKQNRPSHIRYHDWFDGDLFHWDSQNQQHIGSERIGQMVNGALIPHLFARVDEKVLSRTQEFVYVGRLAFDSFDPRTANPVHIVWRCVDYMEFPAPDLLPIYGWTAAGSSSTTGIVAPISGPPLVVRSGQGFKVDAKVRKAIELRAMEVAIAWYAGEGYAVADTSASKSFDLECTGKDGERRRVEVKGTMNTPEFVYLTVNEIESARSGGVSTDLFIVHGIILDRSDANRPIAQGGRIHRLKDWSPLDDELRALQFRYSVPAKN